MTVTADNKRRVVLPPAAKPGDLFDLEVRGDGQFILTRSVKAAGSVRRELTLHSLDPAFYLRQVMASAEGLHNPVVQLQSRQRLRGHCHPGLLEEARFRQHPRVMARFSRKLILGQCFFGINGQGSQPMSKAKL